jgi:hypothetical protein
MYLEPTRTPPSIGTIQQILERSLLLTAVDGSLDEHQEGVDWTCKVKHLMTPLYAWVDALGQLGLSPDSVSEAFDAFKLVLRTQTIPVCEDLEMVVQERFLPQFSLLVDLMDDPLRLPEVIHALEPFIIVFSTSTFQIPPTYIILGGFPIVRRVAGTVVCGS